MKRVVRLLACIPMVLAIEVMRRRGLAEEVRMLRLRVAALEKRVGRAEAGVEVDGAFEN